MQKKLLYIKPLKKMLYIVRIYIGSINSIASAFEAISFRWISRINDVVADNLAKQVLADETAFIVPPNIA